jgi:uncharacterized protein
MTSMQTEPAYGSSGPGPQAPPAPHAAPTIADPGPLGLAGFAMTTFVLSVFNAHVISNAALEVVFLPLALFYGGIAQLLAGMWEFRKGNTFGALAFTSYGSFWLSLAYVIRYVAVPGSAFAKSGKSWEAIGLFLLVWAIFSAYMLVASAKTNRVLFAVFAVLTITFACLAIGQFAGQAAAHNSGWTKIGGWTGLVTAVLAWYASFAGVTNATWGRTVLPTWPAAQ